MKLITDENLSELYEILAFPDDPLTSEGRHRYELAIKEFKTLLKHSWLKNVVSKDSIEILELCAGGGIGGIALTKVIEELGVKVYLLLTDLRENILIKAKSFAEREVSGPVNTLVLDARMAHELNKKFDIVLIYGLSMSHFDPWDTVHMLSSISLVTKDNGLLIIQEADRRYTIFYLTGYQRVLAERVSESNAILSFHVGYEMKSGKFKRAYITFGVSSKPVIGDFYFWGIAELGALLWVFYKDIDLVKSIPQGSYSNVFFVLGRKPRRKLNPYELIKPKFLEKE